MRWVGLGRTGRVVHFYKIFQLALDIDVAILCAHPSVIFPHTVLKRLKISSYFLQHTVTFSNTKQLCESWTDTR